MTHRLLQPHYFSARYARRHATRAGTLRVQARYARARYARIGPTYVSSLTTIPARRMDGDHGLYTVRLV